MKKIPTVFERQYENHKVVGITDTFTSEETKEAFEKGIATVKWDGSCCAIIDGELYKRYDAKKGKTPPEGAIPCCPADPVTGHHPHWVKCDRENPSDKWFWAAFDASIGTLVALACDGENFDGTYEAVGKHFNGNPYGFSDDILIPHGEHPIVVERTFDGVKRFLEEKNIEGIVFWRNGEPVAKIKKSDFGFKWK